MDLTWLSALIVGAALGFCIGTRRSKPPPVEAAVDGDSTKLIPKSPLEIEKLADILDDFKMVSLASLYDLFTVIKTKDVEFEFLFFLCFVRKVLVVRNDLKMGKGKIAAQCRWLKLIILSVSLLSAFFYNFSSYLVCSFAVMQL